MEKLFTFDRHNVLELINNYFAKKKQDIEIGIIEDEYGHEMLEGKNENTKIYEERYDGSITIESEDKEFLDFLKTLTEKELDRKSVV